MAVRRETGLRRYNCSPLTGGPGGRKFEKEKNLNHSQRKCQVLIFTLGCSNWGLAAQFLFWGGEGGVGGGYLISLFEFSFAIFFLFSPCFFHNTPNSDKVPSFRKPTRELAFSIWFVWVGSNKFSIFRFVLRFQGYFGLSSSPNLRF